MAGAAVLAASIGLMGGCINMENELLVKRDGSGLLTQTVALSEMMMSFMGGMGEEGEDGGDTLLEGFRTKAEEQAGRIPGGAVESVEWLEPKKVYRVVLSFPDINQFKGKHLMPNMNMMDGDEDDDDGEGDDGGEGSKFSYANGVLIFTNESTIDQEQISKMGEIDEGVKMMLPMFGDSAITMTIRVDGAIAQTNARHVNPDRRSITIMHMPLGAFMGLAVNQPEAYREAVDTDDPVTMATALEGAVAGLKMDVQPQITIRF